MKSQNKRVIGYVGKQRQLLKKFKEKHQFLENIGQSKSTTNFKTELCKLLKKYPTLKKIVTITITTILQDEF